MAAMPTQYWLVKQEPESYSWDDFVNEGATVWTGIRNYQARNNLRAMKKGDWVLFYHSVKDKQIVGVARVAREHYPDPTAEEGDWSVVELKPVKALKAPVHLDQIKSDPALRDVALVKHSRLSVMPLAPAHFERLLSLGGTRVS